MKLEFTALIPVVYAIIEGMEWLGLRKTIAHLLALPIGILFSFLIIPCDSIVENIVYGLIIGISAAGTCDTIGNCGQVLKGRRARVHKGKRRKK
jgi:hypothetical protein